MISNPYVKGKVSLKRPRDEISSMNIAAQFQKQQHKSEQPSNLEAARAISGRREQSEPDIGKCDTLDQRQTISHRNPYQKTLNANCSPEIQHNMDKPRSSPSTYFQNPYVKRPNPYLKSPIITDGQPRINVTRAVPSPKSTILPMENKKQPPQQDTGSINQVSKASPIVRNPYMKSSSTPSPSVRRAIFSPVLKSKEPSPTRTASRPGTKSGLESMRPPTWKKSNEISTAPVVVPSPSRSNQVGLTRATSSQRPEIPGEALLPDELLYNPNSLLQPIKDEYRSKLSRNARLNETLLNGWTLFGHQKRAILKGLMKRRLILALDMGLGKTLIGCVWARAFKASYENLKIYAICPATLVAEWRRTAENATGLIVEPEAKGKFKPPKDSLDMTVATWQKIPSCVDKRIEHYVVVFDEAHMMQSMESNRTQAALTFVNDKRCVGVLLLTGTPMKNGKPANLFPLLKAVQHPLGRRQRPFEAHFCQGMLRPFGRGSGWVASGQANLKQLHRMIEPKLLYMTKDEYLKELPPMTQETRQVPVSAVFQKQYNEKIRALASLKEAMKTNESLSSERLLGALSDVRIVCAIAKINATAEIANEVLETEPSIVIFATYQKCVTQMAKHLKDCGHQVAFITGQTNPKERQKLVDGFQVRK